MIRLKESKFENINNIFLLDIKVRVVEKLFFGDKKIVFRISYWKLNKGKEIRFELVNMKIEIWVWEGIWR